MSIYQIEMLPNLNYFLCALNWMYVYVCFQECVYCEDIAAAPLEEDLPDMDMGELGEEPDQESQNTDNQSEEPQPQLDAGS